MLRDTDAFDLSATPMSFRPGGAPEQHVRVAVVPPAGDDTVVETRAAEARQIEQEIARLTWTVLDGGATLADRQRLAELVKAQHAQRRRFDR
jgi:hypothetical protein